MQRSISLRTDIAATGLAALTAAAVVIAPIAPATAQASLPAVVHDVRLAASSVPPGGLITSFLHNQTVYCSIICPLLAQTGVTAVSTALRAPETFLAALSAGDVLKAIGAAAASVTGPTEAAALKAIDADAAIPAQRALNAFEVGVVGLLNVLPAVRDGLPGIATALQKARQDTFDALNLPFVPNPTPTVQPHGVFQVAVVGGINVVAAVIFPAFNDVLAGIFEVPDAMAQELAKTGNPVRALAAGIRTAAGVVAAAGKVITQAVVTAVHDVRDAAGAQAAGTSRVTPTTATAITTHPTTPTTPTTKAPKTTAALTTTAALHGDSGPAVTSVPKTTTHAQPNPVRDAASNLRRAVHNLVEKVTPKPSGKPDKTAGEGTDKTADKTTDKGTTHEAGSHGK
ncbi:hypothetical protein H7J86_22775 [Mycobacterium hackensackense]|uniref:hypothetical protein n=1 Tax=Mycobacterium hackensackense TaxID=228909 RepID=UPI002265A8A1|nr:hypothetical protein [Mycobacterium hackensackense]MCV7254991.1 hypothetical protein [Mycobacterium hackensackense]